MLRRYTLDTMKKSLFLKRVFNEDSSNIFFNGRHHLSNYKKAKASIEIDFYAKR